MIALLLLLMSTGSAPMTVQNSRALNLTNVPKWNPPVHGNACFARPPIHFCIWREPDYSSFFTIGGVATTYTDIEVQSYYLIRIEPRSTNADHQPYADGDMLACMRQLAFTAMPRGARKNPHGIRIVSWKDILDVELHGDHVEVVAHDPRVTFKGVTP